MLFLQFLDGIVLIFAIGKQVAKTCGLGGPILALLPLEFLFQLLDDSILGVDLFG